jgi:hypothetical protein
LIVGQGPDKSSGTKAKSGSKSVHT